MPDYTYNEIMKMQNDAIRRAEEMQKRARQSAGLAEKNEKTEPPSAPQEPKHIPMPKGYLGQRQSEVEKEDKQTTQKPIKDFNSAMTDINMDSDKALLLSLIMLLSEENADELLIMALIYMLT